jgi:hypothetical protein
MEHFKSKQFVKHSDNIFYCDITIPYFKNNTLLKYIVDLHGKFSFNNVKNSFISNIYFDLIMKNNEPQIKNINIKKISFLKSIHNDLSIKKYLDKNENIFDIISSEFNNDIESDIYSMIETMFSKISLSFIDNKIIIKFEFVIIYDDFTISSLKIKLFDNKHSNKLIVKKEKLPNQSLNLKFPKITSYFIMIIIYSFYFIFSNSNMHIKLLREILF